MLNCIELTKKQSSTRDVLCSMEQNRSPEQGTEKQKSQLGEGNIPKRKGVTIYDNGSI